jgi:hypothetical protein
VDTVRRSPGRIVALVAITADDGPYERVSPVTDHPLRVTHDGREGATVASRI